MNNTHRYTRYTQSNIRFLYQHETQSRGEIVMDRISGNRLDTDIRPITRYLSKYQTLDFRRPVRIQPDTGFQQTAGHPVRSNDKYAPC